MFQIFRKMGGVIIEKSENDAHPLQLGMREYIYVAIFINFSIGSR